MEAVFYLTRTYWKLGNKVFICFCVLFYSEFFSVSGNYYWNQGEVHFLKTNHIPAMTPIFPIFQGFFKVEAAFLNSGNIFFNILHPVSVSGFSAQWK